MNYYFKRILENKTFDEAVEKVTEELKKEGFGILTVIDVQATLKKKLNVDFRNYHILGACNPPFAYRSLQAEAAIGILLPCNVVVRELEDGRIEIDIIDPLVAMQVVENDAMEAIATEIHDKLEKVANSL
ncbi:MAG TPA: DUF302 domain-containing protein [Ignavibacteria bacterium]|nr:DUF302 domain-containing protein [Ignavibacteria bacterium]